MERQRCVVCVSVRTRGCSRFKDLKDESSSVAAIIAIIIGITIGVCICCACCCVGIAIMMYGTAAVCGMCFRKNKRVQPL
mmetsp:Transcript_7947/g.13416  ORF Transcript_7947/g.13416 Transcript_7947/m.13416 type:complete len:80 (+) Transcript_7947:92-331(+)